MKCQDLFQYFLNIVRTEVHTNVRARVCAVWKKLEKNELRAGI